MLIPERAGICVDSVVPSYELCALSICVSESPACLAVGLAARQEWSWSSLLPSGYLLACVTACVLNGLERLYLLVRLKYVQRQ